MPMPSKPTALHKLQGTFHATKHGRDRAQEPIPVGDLGLADAPPWLTEEQRKAWAYAVKHAPAGVMKRIDREVLALWVQAADRIRQANLEQEELDRTAPMPLLVKTSKGLAVSPYLRVIEKAGQTMLACARELGFSPASRTRIQQDITAAQEKTGGGTFSRLKVLHGGKAAG